MSAPTNCGERPRRSSASPTPPASAERTSSASLVASFRFLQRRRAKFLTRMFLGLSFSAACAAIMLLDSPGEAIPTSADYVGSGDGDVARKGYFIEPKQLEGVETVVYHGEQTFAILQLAPDGELRACELIEAIEEDEIAVTLANLQRSYNVSPIDFQTTLDVMTACRNLSVHVLDTKSGPGANASVLFKSAAPTTKRPLPIREAIMNGPLALVRGILPGTKWCGNGDIAETYRELGDDWRIDTCCREHDHCPIKVKAFRNRYGYFNSGVYTKSHCDCDARFHDCLKTVNSSVSNILGQAYFDILRVRCVVHDKTLPNGTFSVKESEKPLSFREVNDDARISR